MEVIAKIHNSEEILLLYYYAFKGKLLDGLIHNIGSPLQSVMFFMEFMESSRNAPSDFAKIVESKLELVSQEVRIVADILSDFRSFQQLAESKEAILNIPEFYHLFARILRADLFCKHNVSISIESTLRVAIPRMPSRIFVLIFVELVRNALRAIKSTGNKGMMKFQLDDDPMSRDRIIVRVGDTGCGLTTGVDLHTLFKPSYSSWNLSKKDVMGMPSFGLGLYCVRDLLFSYGGEISLRRDADFTWAEVIIPVETVIP
jgi:signal transduction histidine kinase